VLQAIILTILHILVYSAFFCEKNEKSVKNIIRVLDDFLQYKQI